MAKLIFLLALWLLCTPVAALDVTNLADGSDLSAAIDYVPEGEAWTTWEQIWQRADWRPLPKTNLGYRPDAVWTRLTLTYSGAKPLTFVLRNPRPGMDALDVWLLDAEQNVVECYQLGDLRPPAQHPIVHRYTLLPVTLPPGGQVTVLTRLENLGPMTAHWLFQRVEDYSGLSAQDWLLWGLYGGIILALVLYNLHLGWSLKRGFFLVYVVIALLSLVIQFNLQGVLRLFEHGLPLTWLNAISWVLPYFLFVALAGFAMLFFQTANTLPGPHRWLCWALALLTLCYGLNWALLVGWPAYRASGVLAIAFGSVLVLAAIFYIALCATQDKRVGAWLYLLGQGIFASAYVALILLLLGWLHWPGVSAQWLIPMATVVEVFLLAGAQSRYLQSQNQRMHRYQLIAATHSRFSTLGRTLGYVLHQWKLPLARLGSLLTELQAGLAYQSQPAFYRSCHEALPQCAQTLDFLDQTLQEMRSFYRTDQGREFFKPADKIAQARDLLQGKALDLAVEITFQNDYHGAIHNHAQGFVHVLMVLLDNALDIIAERKINPGWIGVCLAEVDGRLQLSVTDNAGGIRCRPVERVFDEFFSAKMAEGSGLGLSIARMITQDCLQGELSVCNQEPGACFTLHLPLTPAGVT
ncbi:MAG: sensor histidine kinase [Methylococcales bacterium]|nr:sensor histidine kinase [Methylococcales bacterium]